MKDMDWRERRVMNKLQNEPRNKRIREMTGAELDAARGGEIPENEYVGEVNNRIYWQEMNQKDLEFQATFDPWAAVELRRRNGELPR